MIKLQVCKFSLCLPGTQAHFYTSTRPTSHLREPQIRDINAAALKDILELDFCPAVKFHQLIARGCQAYNQILDVVNSTVYISNSTFSNARARGLSVIDSNAKISDTVFRNLTMSNMQDGGALYVQHSSGNSLDIQASNFPGNNANDTSGGAMYLKCANCHVEDVRFVENTSGFHGGAVFIDHFGDNATFRNCLFANNTAGFSGVVYACPDINVLRFNGCSFIGNAGYQGGALSFWGVYSVWVDSCRFERNSVHPEPQKLFHPGTGAALMQLGMAIAIQVCTS